MPRTLVARAVVHRCRSVGAAALGVALASASLARPVPIPIDNPSFEQGLVFWQIGFSSIASTLDATFNQGLPPTDGALMSIQIAGMMTPEAAEAWMALAPGTLQAYYQSIGGIGPVGNYSVIRRWLPAGVYSFDWISEDGDVSDPTYLDHTFYVVDGRIHPLGNGLQEPQTTFSTEVFETQGGIMYLVSANGGDIVLGPNLYTDNFRIAQPPACPGDADGDQFVGVPDIAVVIAQWGAMGFLPGDVDGDFVVGLSDISVVVSNWGADCSGES